MGAKTGISSFLSKSSASLKNAPIMPSSASETASPLQSPSPLIFSRGISEIICEIAPMSRSTDMVISGFCGLASTT